MQSLEQRWKHMRACLSDDLDEKAVQDMRSIFFLGAGSALAVCAQKVDDPQAVQELIEQVQNEIGVVLTRSEKEKEEESNGQKMADDNEPGQSA